MDTKEENSWEQEMFLKKFKNLIEEEKMFIKEADAAPGLTEHNNFSMADKYKVLSSFYLAKQIEASKESNDNHSTAIRWLTLALVFIGAIDIILRLCGC